jgi:hypothetical protein
MGEQWRPNDEGAAMLSENVQNFPVAETDQALDKELRDWFRDHFGSVLYRWAEPDYYGILSVGEQLAGRLAVFDRQVFWAMRSSKSAVSAES